MLQSRSEPCRLRADPSRLRGFWYHRCSDFGRNTAPSRRRRTSALRHGQYCGTAPDSSDCPRRLCRPRRRCKLPPGDNRRASGEDQPDMAAHSPSEGWIGASLLRKEDARHLLGHGMFIADIRDAGHAGRRLRAQPDGARARAAGDQAAGRRGQRLHARRHRPAQHPRGRARARRAPPQPLPGAGRRPRALCRPADRRLHAADARAGRGPRRPGRRSSCEELPAVVDCVAAMRPGSPRVFESWPDNAYITSTVNEGDPVVARVRADPAAPAVPHEPAGHRARSNAAACWPTGTTATTSSWSISRPRAAT